MPLTAESLPISLGDLVGYIRVSTEGQKDGLSLMEQARLIQQYCDTNGYRLLAIYSDAASGENIEKRYGFKAAISHVIGKSEDGPTTSPAAGLIVLSLDRFSRSVHDSEIIAKSLSSAGKMLLSTQQNYDLKNPTGKVMFQVNQAFNEYMRAELVDRMQRLRQAKVDNGGWVGHRPPFGFIIQTVKRVDFYGREIQSRELIPDPDEQMVIRLVRRLRKWVGEPHPKKRGPKLDRISTGSIAAYLNKRAETDPRFLPKDAKPLQKPRQRAYIKPPSGLWTSSNVWRILNPEHTSEYRCQESLKEKSRRESKAS